MTIRCGRLAGCDLYLDGLFLLLLMGLALAGRPAEVVVLLAALVTHELAHLWVGTGFGLRFRSIWLLPFGGVAAVDNLLLAPPAAVALTALAGPLNNLLLAALCWLLGQSGWLLPPLSEFALRVNLSLALFNLLPALPLDGGRVLHAWWRQRFGFAQPADLLRRLGYALAACMAFAAALAALFGLYLWTLPVLAVFVWRGAGREATLPGIAKLSRFWRGDAGLRDGVRESVVLVAAGDLTVAQLLEQMTQEHPYHLVLLADREGRLEGYVDEGALRQAVLAGELRATLREIRSKRR